MPCEQVTHRLAFRPDERLTRFTYLLSSFSCRNIPLGFLGFWYHNHAPTFFSLLEFTLPIFFLRITSSPPCLFVRPSITLQVVAHDAPVILCSFYLVEAVHTFPLPGTFLSRSSRERNVIVIST